MMWPGIGSPYLWGHLCRGNCLQVKGLGFIDFLLVFGGFCLLWMLKEMLGVCGERLYHGKTNSLDWTGLVTPFYPSLLSCFKKGVRDESRHTLVYCLHWWPRRSEVPLHCKPLVGRGSSWAMVSSHLEKGRWSVSKAKVRHAQLLSASVLRDALIFMTEVTEARSSWRSLLRVDVLRKCMMNVMNLKQRHGDREQSKNWES